MIFHWFLYLHFKGEYRYRYRYSGTCLIRDYLNRTKSLYTNECFTIHFNLSNPTFVIPPSVACLFGQVALYL